MRTFRIHDLRHRRFRFARLRLARLGGCRAAAGTNVAVWSVVDYRAALATLPRELQDDLVKAWGAPEDDPACQAGQFQFAAVRCGKSIIAVQPERGEVANRTAEYHDLSRTPRHAYVAFYLWLRLRGD